MKKIKETKISCSACGHEEYISIEDKALALGKAFDKAGSSVMSLGVLALIVVLFFAAWPLGVIALIAFLMMTKSKSEKLSNRCPKCNSKAISKQKVTHEVQS